MFKNGNSIDMVDVQEGGDNVEDKRDVQELIRKYESGDMHISEFIDEAYNLIDMCKKEEQSK
jgi:pyridoxine 5'-phosphate synthase PdxJ